ncbi:MAG: hypothetical protein GXY88_01900 [Tissierellia bacterium]|nr:hypothetical protein [Tissierellia bacterium]
MDKSNIVNGDYIVIDMELGDNQNNIIYMYQDALILKRDKGRIIHTNKEYKGTKLY